MKADRRFALDTSVFVNPASASAFGPTPTAALTRFLEQARGLDGVEFLVPPSVYGELMYFAEEASVPKDLLLLLRQQAPRKNEVKVPGIFIYTLVDEIRDRIDRGLRLAERAVRDALHEAPPPEPERGAKGPRPDAEPIQRLRESHRRIMREGMLDSRADVDLLLLCYETGSTLVTADQGLLLWAEHLGLEILPHEQLPAFLASRRSAGPTQV
jgi:RNA ligase partner protein